MKPVYFLAALASLATAAPQPAKTIAAVPTPTQEGAQIATEYFQATINYPSNSAINGKPLSANGLSIWIGKPQSRYCPPNIRKAGGCHNGYGTSFMWPGDGGLGMGSVRQQSVFVNPVNAGVHYANASTGNTHGGILKGWSYNVGSNGVGTLSWARGLYACSAGSGVWEIYAGVLGVDNLGNSCLGPFSASTKSINGPTAYTYT